MNYVPYLLNSVSQSSGHLASGLGTSKGWQLLCTMCTTRLSTSWFGMLATKHAHIRFLLAVVTACRLSKDGLHPFPWRQKPEYDTLSDGHSSTSIQVPDSGMAISAKKKARIVKSSV
ncbi:hypothetical protein O9929_08760 [Vibrio lentus]|nr:hypothetical protein [Vibrio lentus]